MIITSKSIHKFKFDKRKYVQMYSQNKAKKISLDLKYFINPKKAILYSSSSLGRLCSHRTLLHENAITVRIKAMWATKSFQKAISRFTLPLGSCVNIAEIT